MVTDPAFGTSHRRSYSTFPHALQWLSLIHIFNQLKAVIGDAKIIDTSKLKADTVQILSKVEMRNVKNNMKMAYTIVSETEANLKEGKISDVYKRQLFTFMACLFDVTLQI